MDRSPSTTAASTRLNRCCSDRSQVKMAQRRRYLFVCINRRPDDNPKGCCAAKGSEEVYKALKAEVAARGLAKLEARVCTSSCLDQCATGVSVLVEPDHFFYGRVTVEDVPEIVDALQAGGRVERLVLGSDVLVEAAELLGASVLATEQYPKGLGPTIEPLGRRLHEIGAPRIEKTAFSA